MKWINGEKQLPPLDKWVLAYYGQLRPQRVFVLRRVLDNYLYHYQVTNIINGIVCTDKCYGDPTLWAEFSPPEETKKNTHINPITSRWEILDL